ncbi:MAG: PIN domain-containing protein [Candidatus Bathyarchaeia archaeon]
MSGSRNYALDSSFLIYHHYKGDALTNDILKAGLLNPVSLSEALYVVCRKEGVATALNFVMDALKTVRIVPSERVALMAGQFKCKYPISLADCWVLATSKVFNVPALFAFRERELLAYIEDVRRETEVKFLDEVTKG